MDDPPPREFFSPAEFAEIGAAIGVTDATKIRQLRDALETLAWLAPIFRAYRQPSAPSGPTAPQGRQAHRYPHAALVRQADDPTFVQACCGDSDGDPCSRAYVRLVAGLLGDKTLATGERYYNKARALEAARGHQLGLDRLRPRLLKTCRPDLRGF